jgi:hypothetical protein
MLPESLQGSDGRGVIDLLEKAAQALALGAAMLGIDRIVDIDVEFGREEFSKARIGKVQHIAAPSDEIDEVVYEL